MTINKKIITKIELKYNWHLFNNENIMCLEHEYYVGIIIKIVINLLCLLVYIKTFRLVELKVGLIIMQNLPCIQTYKYERKFDTQRIILK